MASVMHDSGYILIPVPILIKGKTKSLIPIPIPAKKLTDSGIDSDSGIGIVHHWMAYKLSLPLVLWMRIGLN